MFVLGMLWLNRRARSAAQRSEGFATACDGSHTDRFSGNSPRRPALPLGLAVAPIAVVLVVNFLAAELWIPHWQTAYLAEPRYGGVTAADVRGIWAAIIALLVACGLLVVFSERCRQRLSEILRIGALEALLPIFNTASEVGYGATIAALPAFVIIKESMLNFVPGNPLVSEATTVTVLAGITGSASGGLSIALESLGATYYERALEFGLDPEVLHRVASIACGGLDSLPHNGAVITLLTICGLTHKQSYLDIGVVTVVVPLIALALVIGLASL